MHTIVIEVPLQSSREETEDEADRILEEEKDWLQEQNIEIVDSNINIHTDGSITITIHHK